jgi:predicted O-linked N-acetylglucosamine transferase (SPINDLY family)
MLSQPADLNAATDIFTDALSRATDHQLSIADLFGCAGQLDALGHKKLAADLYKTWIAHNSSDLLLHAAYFNYGVALAAVDDRPGAIMAFQECIRLKPEFQQSYINLGRVFEDCGQTGEAVTQWLKLAQNLGAINGESVAHKLTALEQTARVLEAANNDAPAEDALRQSLDINPHQTKVLQHWVSLRQRQCKWPVVAEWDRVGRSHLLTGISSLSLQCFADDPIFQLATAYHYARKSIGMTPAMVHTPAGRADRARLRIGYVSSDLREHAVGFAMTDVMMLSSSTIVKMSRSSRITAASIEPTRRSSGSCRRPIIGSISATSTMIRLLQRFPPTESIFSSTSTATQKMRVPRYSRDGRPRSR